MALCYGQNWTLPCSLLWGHIEAATPGRKLVAVLETCSHWPCVLGLVGAAVSPRQRGV